MKLLIDMNLSPRWVSFFNSAGIEADHWSNLGAANAPDWQIMDFAAVHRCVILTQDLDFGILLATTRKARPSVLQIRTDDVSPDTIGSFVIRAVRQMSSELEEGALITIDPKRTRLRLLPLRFSDPPPEKE